ncbi:hypothetical protein E2C01_019027 [Portunus trituberculatus]|uniref:Uncharacterized protein n=1 Tax=Portunus trituberculatus TaxID=210409 RepID=A0A5B7DY54_PORTR|nr:hypothetical protein [Portunus trituberculatus]
MSLILSLLRLHGELNESISLCINITFLILINLPAKSSNSLAPINVSILQSFSCVTVLDPPTCTPVLSSVSCESRQEHTGPHASPLSALLAAAQAAPHLSVSCLSQGGSGTPAGVNLLLQGEILAAVKNNTR